MNSSGPGSENPVTISKLFRDTALRYGRKTALLVEKQGRVVTWCWTKYLFEVIAFAKAMHLVGVKER